MKQSLATPIAVGGTLLLAACASVPPAIQDSTALSECRAHFMALDQATDHDGIRDASAWRIPGFPYLRANRFLASFRGGLDSARFEAWVEQLRHYGLESRDSELRNLDGEDVEQELRQLDRCGAAWARRDLADPDRRLALVERVQVPDDYATWKRALGLYPLAVPFMKIGIRGFQADTREDYAKPIGELGGAPMLWKLADGEAGAESGPVPMQSVPRDVLGIPALSEEQWWQLARTHAPALWIESGGDYDVPGSLGLRGGEPTLNTEAPAVYFLPTYTRFGGHVLPQLVYVVWFSERPEQSWLDSYAGKLDGVIWRVTLAPNGDPLMYDTVHSCGCYHHVYPAKPFKRRPQDNGWQERVSMPQRELPSGPLAIRLQTATHYVRRLVAASQLEGQETHHYRLRDYRELQSLPDGDETRSLFDADGLVDGTQRGERWWLWPSGIDSPGAMRQWGRHATAFVGRRHFDDPFLFEKLFVAP